MRSARCLSWAIWASLRTPLSASSTSSLSTETKPFPFLSQLFGALLLGVSRLRIPCCSRTFPFSLSLRSREIVLLMVTVASLAACCLRISSLSTASSSRGTRTSSSRKPLISPSVSFPPSTLALCVILYLLSRLTLIKGLPYQRVNLRHGVPRSSPTFTCTACAGTLVLEFGLLSRLTGDPRFEVR